jgi:proteasome lid subunit RPN8/RPN11
MLQPLPKPAPARQDRSQGKVIGAIHADAYPIFLYESVLEEILDYSEADLTRELGGFLLGGVFEDQRPYIEIRHFLPAVDARSQHSSLTFTHETWSTMHRERDRRFPRDMVVGWHHTHPNFGIFLSEHDKFIHRNYFSEPWQVALVVDPRRQEFGFFQWRGAEIEDCGFICVWGQPAAQ